MTIEEATGLLGHDRIASLTKKVWADLGCGSGIFTHALANLLCEGSLIYAVDKSISAFKKIPFPKNVIMKPVELDFETSTLPFDNLDGILLANSFHFVKDKKNFVEKTKNSLNDNGIFLFVEYDTEISNYWVPYPVSFFSLKQIFNDAGYADVAKINERPSRFNKANLYSAIIRPTIQLK